MRSRVSRSDSAARCRCRRSARGRTWGIVHEPQPGGTVDADRSQQALADAVAAITASLDLDETLQAIVATGRRLTGAAYGALGVLGADRRITRFVVSGISQE